ncbi:MULTISPECIES: bifunctional salicylyl-CoA 5-hydroxylase/oxidoreductase [Paenalcaligenes]|mgnify:FL=1|uniref:Bifunctional salicylyl-CoA 5-hydroxylase/oxidoreductase n=1 Tax=Paenalcaligenes hermetiae TaxID=1157987 RepID=A0ABP9M8D8_9BURK|nr:bifunctional salicylyl-CoA 5-hydroxylase/oxidoreductase [Paenalcaligenes sp.]
MKIVCIGGGPAGLYFGLLMKLQNPDNDIVVVERNRPYDTFGWGVVFSDATMENLRQADPVSAQTIGDAFNHWDDIETHFKGRAIRSKGHGFIGIGRKKLLNILQARCEEVGVELVFETNVEDEIEVARKYNADLVIASDGINSRIRNKYPESYQPDIDERNCRFVWLGTKKVFDAFNFIFVENEHGWFQAHAYRFEDGLSTFIVETPNETWEKAGIENMSQEEGIKYCEALFAPYLDGNELISNASHLRGSAIWIRFPRVICNNWVHWADVDNKKVPFVLMGDAAHTAHFSIGSGTKLALEDAISLAEHLKNDATLEQALEEYSAARSVDVLRIQNAARNSTEWFENVARYAHMEPEQFTYSMLTRSQRISHENLRLRDAEGIEQFERWFAQQAGMTLSAEQTPPPPMFTPYALRDMKLKNRIVFAPTLMYSAENGVVNAFHQNHYSARALGGAALVMAEMTAVTPEGRVTPGCAGLWNDEQMTAWREVVQQVQQNGACMGIQLGHAGRRGSTQRGWENVNKPLQSDNWDLLSASAIAYDQDSATPAAITREQMDTIRDAFVAATQRADQAGFDCIELQAAHGYLLSSFISPLTNQRTDEFGGSLENRMKFPLEVFTAMRAVWPENKPMFVRISATDWAEGGTTVDEAVEIARLFKAAGADLIDVSSGEVVKAQKPIYGRMFQTPFADRVRNEAGIATMAVGAILEADHANSIIAAGRADLCALSRGFLANPNWPLHEAAKLGYHQVAWPKQYQWGQDWLERNENRPVLQG